MSIVRTLNSTEDSTSAFKRDVSSRMMQRRLSAFPLPGKTNGGMKQEISEIRSRVIGVRVSSTAVVDA